ncbi:MAG: alpha/beta hydrolase [Alphaproteobacteria bacterium]|nr:alpha/beta hydrolase [Alphaproteobacteria bacterium]
MSPILESRRFKNDPAQMAGYRDAGNEVSRRRGGMWARASVPVLNFNDAPPSPYIRSAYGLQPRIDFIDRGDGIKLRHMSVAPATRPVADLLIVPGLNSPIENFQRLIFPLAHLGFRTSIFDLRSQGYSGRPRDMQRNHVDSFDQYGGDLRCVYDKTRSSGLPLIVMAFSMGAHILVRELMWKNMTADHVVLVSPAIRARELPDGTAFHRLVLRSLAKVWDVAKPGDPFFAPRGWDFSRRDDLSVLFGMNPYTSDWRQYQAAVTRMKENPMLRIGWPTGQWVKSHCDSRGILDSESSPIMESGTVIFAEYDTVVCNRTAKEFFRRTAPNVELQQVQAKHALELGGPAVISRLIKAATTLSRPSRVACRVPWVQPVAAAMA